jgi:ABC-type branched-subunit amino acid transport system substrate-binding protein
VADTIARPGKKSGLPWDTYPAWWKVAAAFGVGILIAGLSLLVILPKGLSSLGGRAGGVGGLGPGEAGGSEDYIIDPVTGEIIGTAGSLGASGTSGSGGSAGRTAGRGGGAARGSGGTGGSAGSGGSGGGIQCAPGRNGGATAPGVTATEVKMGATVAESGIAQAFLGEVSQAMEAARIKFNNDGGACGRRLNIIYRDDEWKPDRGFEYIRNLVEQEKVFALAVVPSSEGLNSASGYVRDNGIPVPGADGMIKSQNTNPYIWPVASATTTQMHVMMKNAWDRGARNPAIVFENTYRFGVEGAAAFNAAYQRLSGSSLGSGASCGGRFCGIPAGQGSYGTEVAAVNNACNTEPRCDFLAILLEPVTAQNWMKTSGAKQPKDLSKGMGAAQPLFTYSFGDTCHDKCNGMWVWTGYNPPIEQYANSPAVREYVADLDSKSRAADEFNQFTEGGYIGMKLIIEALKRTPNLTRQNFANTLNSISLDTGLSPGLSWSASSHFANPAAQAFEIQSKNGFTGWRFVQGYVSDPWLGQDS